MRKRTIRKSLTAILLDVSNLYSLVKDMQARNAPDEQLDAIMAKLLAMDKRIDAINWHVGNIAAHVSELYAHMKATAPPTNEGTTGL